MPTLNVITLAEIVEQVKKEARVKGSDNLDQFIKDTCNEMLLDYCEKVRYFEMLLLNQTITLTDATGTYTIPAALQSIHRVRYKVGAEGAFYTIKQRPQYVENTSGGRPRYYDLAGTQISIFPFDQVFSTDTLSLDYYKYPSKLTVDGDVFPIPKLIPAMKKQLIYRTHVYNQEMAVAGAFSSSALESEVRSRRSQTKDNG